MRKINCIGNLFCEEAIEKPILLMLGSSAFSHSLDPKAECRIVSIEHVVRSRQHAVSRSTLVNGERKKTGAAHG